MHMLIFQEVVLQLSNESISCFLCANLRDIP